MRRVTRATNTPRFDDTISDESLLATPRAYIENGLSQSDILMSATGVTVSIALYKIVKTSAISIRTKCS